MTKRWIALLLLLPLAVSAPAHAVPGAVEASGTVVDRDGNPIAGARVTFRPKETPDTSYDAKTNKKGRYFIAGMYSSQGDMWQISIEAEGFLPVEMVVESRTANRVLVGDILTSKIKAGAALPEIMIRKLGSAKIDFTLAPADEVMAEARAAAAAKAAAEAAEAGEVPEAEAPKDTWEEALQLASTGDVAGSIPLFEKAIEKVPEDAERRRTFAKVLYQAERLDDAEAQALAAVELAPDGVDSRMVLYSVHVAQGDLERAKTTLQEAQAIAPQDVRVLEQLAYVAGERGNTAGAIAAYEQVVAVDPENTNGWLSLGDLYAASGQSEKSEQAYQRVTDLDPSNAHQIFFNLGALIINKPDRSEDETRKAISAFRKAIELKPDYAQAHKQLAFALLGIGDRSGARDSLKRYIEVAPDAPDAAHMQQLVQTLQ